jgi:hypothetical protein
LTLFYKLHRIFPTGCRDDRIACATDMDEFVKGPARQSGKSPDLAEAVPRDHQSAAQILGSRLDVLHKSYEPVFDTVFARSAFMPGRILKDAKPTNFG